MRKRHALTRGITVLALAAALPLAACGDDDEKESSGSTAAELVITATEAGKANEVDIQAPDGSGVIKITLTNEGKKPHSAQIIGVEGDHTQQDVEKALAEAMESGPIPDWFLIVGGVETVEPGQTATVTQELEPGTYYAIDDETEGEGAPLEGSFNEFEITGDPADAELPEGPTVKAVDYGFEAEGLTAGEKSTVIFENAGKQPHHIVAAPIIGDATLGEISKFFESEGEGGGPPPVDFEDSTSTSVTDGGRTIATELKLKKGRYAFVCFISDRTGGPPHVAKGMISEVEVE